MPKTVLVTGATGQLGRSIQSIAQAHPELEFTFVDRSMMDLADPASIAARLEMNRYDFIVNCAAHTAVDKAESEPELADRINHLAVKQLAETAKEQGAFLIHVSTDYVFDGCHYKPYEEDHPTDPVNRYGATKLLGERAMQQSGVSGAIIRTSWVYSEFGSNFVKTMLRLGAERDLLTVISDQVGTPTYAADLAQAIVTMIEQRVASADQTGCEVFHFSNEGACSWYDFAVEIFDLMDMDCQVKPIPATEYPTPAKRPHFSLLSKQRIKAQLGTGIPHWKHSLKRCLQKIKEQNNG
ncbi:dTDP-4-dehydrorhamnose reductase [Halopseudomonas xinjiangensis]|uniref:dTDP-4-dehydrorhamnose reductase n=1 Tax=Halopseudomonas xinjiangensis TaxID=487184 RepID=A0A1H1NMS0_9GAMM|nr:dTDP-4-dehydrorhamnose reductase [Halopseudomonas xinjiangensis]SDS00268.1 dTDP-4-dehydrorhamnose reductase [Halopseudomonas xinjiangensis]